MRSLSILTALILFALGASGCGGTEAGNPSIVATTSSITNGITPVDQPGTSPSLSSFSAETSQILTALCSKLNSCDSSLSLTQCSTGLGTTSGFGVKFGIAAGGPDTFNAIIAAEDSGELTASSAAVARCDSDIAALSCSVVTSAYPASAPQDFSKVPSLIPASSTSCQGVF